MQKRQSSPSEAVPQTAAVCRKLARSHHRPNRRMTAYKVSIPALHLQDVGAVATAVHGCSRVLIGRPTMHLACRRMTAYKAVATTVHRCARVLVGRSQ